MTRLVFVFILSLYLVQNVSAQCTLTIRQVGTKSALMDSLYIANYDDATITRINDSTLEFTHNLSEPDYLYIMIDDSQSPRWHTRLWLDPQIKRRELIIDYSKKTAALQEPNEWDVILQKIASFKKSGRYTSADSILLAYIEQYPDSYTSLWLFTHSSFIGDRKTKNEKLTVFNKLNPSLNKYPEYRQAKASILDRKYTVTGAPFKEFSLTDINGQIFNSSSINNKWIVLHFWATTCGPCVKEMDEMVNFYSFLDTSKIAFISVSMDDDENRWKNSKTTNKIKWTSVWQPDNVYGELCLNYNVTAMPFFIIFNKEKKIYLVTFGADELELIKNTLRTIE